ncbi:hypothetical protein HNV12_01350 [Methanococcoides sp. SA1]|nr:hypothetical protein [Methanococcoides sp. SA1]
MVELKSEDSYVKFFMGSTYDLGRPETIAELKSLLEQVVADLPEDGSLEISEFVLEKGKMYYILSEGIVQ